MSLIRGDALTIPLADNTVDLIVTSPPYFALRSYTDACGTCGGIAASSITPITGGTAKSTLNGGGPQHKQNAAVEPDPDCPECNGSGRGHYAGQLGSEATPAAFIDALISVTRECVRVLKPSGSLFVNLGDKYAGSGGHNNGGLTGDTSSLKLGERGNVHQDTTRATRRSAPDRYNQSSDGIRTKSLMGLPWRYALACIDQLGLILRAEIIWSKPNGLPESVQDRVRRSHEQWFHFTLEPRYYSAVDEIREAHTSHAPGKGGLNMRGDSSYQLRANGSGLGEWDSEVNPLGKLPGSVWTAEEDELWLPQSLAAEIMQRVANGEIDAQEAAGFLANDPPRTHEQWFHFTLEPRYYSAVDEIREASTDTNASRAKAIDAWDGIGAVRDSKVYEARPNEQKHSGVPGVGTTFMGNPLGKLPGSVWTVPTEPLRVPDHLPQHFAAFPSEWPRRIILGWSPTGICTECGEGRRPVVAKESFARRPGGVDRIGTWYDDAGPARAKHDIGNVLTDATITGESCACHTPTAPTRPAVILDPFAGTGTVPAVANALGRYGIGIDLSADYLKLARWRLNDPGLRAKALQVDKPVPEVPGQMALL